MGAIFSLSCRNILYNELTIYTVTGKNGPPKKNAVKCTIYNTI